MSLTAVNSPPPRLREAVDCGQFLPAIRERLLIAVNSFSHVVGRFLLQSIPSRTLRDAADPNQRLSRLCEPLPTAVIPIRAEAASLVEGSCVPSVASDQRSSETFRSYSLLISFFYTKGTVPFVLSSYQIT